MTKINEEQFFTVCEELVTLIESDETNKGLRSGKMNAWFSGVKMYDSPTDAKLALCAKKGLSYKEYDPILEKVVKSEGKKMLPKMKTYFSQCVKAYLLLGNEEYQKLDWKELKKVIEKVETPYQKEVKQLQKAITTHCKTENQGNLEKLRAFVKTLK